MNDLVSVVIPVYNVERFLRACVDSVIGQTYANIEIILVDDGSTDGCSAICDDYALQDERVKIIHKPNGGLSDARNAGIGIAKGKYITFIDSDDYVSDRLVELLYTELIKNNAQISFCDHRNIPEDENACSEVGEYNTQCYGGRECIREMYLPKRHGMDFIACAKLYLLSLFTDSGILYPVGRIYEDSFTTFKLMYHTEKMVFLDAEMYYYRMRDGSITKSKVNAKYLDKLAATQEACDFFERHSEQELFNCAYNFHMRVCCDTIYCFNTSGDESLKKLVKPLIKRFRHDISFRKLARLGIVRMAYYILASIFPVRALLKIAKL